MSGFYPEGYTPPKPTSNSYFRVTPGTHKIRIITKPELYFTGWSEDSEGRHPHRSVTVDPSVKVDKWQPSQGLLVYSYDSAQIMFWEVTQRSIQDKLFQLATDPDFGDPRDYDIKVTRKGEALATEYDLTPLSKAQPSDEVVKAADEAVKRLNFEGYLKGEQIFKD